MVCRMLHHRLRAPVGEAAGVTAKSGTVGRRNLINTDKRHGSICPFNCGHLVQMDCCLHSQTFYPFPEILELLD